MACADARYEVTLAISRGYLDLARSWSTGSIFSSTIVFFSPASRISVSERDPSEFTRSKAASPAYLTPFFTQVPCAVAKNRPSFHSVTRTIELWDSQLKS